MIIVNAPFLVGWILYSVSRSLTMLYVTNVILGIGIGFMEAPIMTYIAESSQPDLRAILTSLPGAGLYWILRNDFIFYTVLLPHSYNKGKRDALFLKFILE